MSVRWCQEMSQNAVSSGPTRHAEEERGRKCGASLGLWDWHLQCSINRRGRSRQNMSRSYRTILCMSGVHVCNEGLLSFRQNETGRGYNEFLAAAKQMDKLPVALCSEKEVWAKYGIVSDTISIFRKADLHQEHLKLSEPKKIDTDGLTRFLTLNNIQFVTEYNQATAVGLFQSEVKTHVLLIAKSGSSDSDPLQQLFRDVAQKYAGKMLFVLVNGKEKPNARVLEYFGLKSRDLPRIGIYDGGSDKKWLMKKGEITNERLQNFCDSFLDGELQKQNPGGKTEL